MSDELLSYYEKELAFIRQLGAEFSNSHPKIAGHLKISSENIEDPHVSRLVEAFAYLNARIQHKLDDDFPELSDALLGVLYPHYQRPIPSMSIIQLPPAAELDSVFHLPAGATLETEAVQGKNCKFKTCYPVDIVPAQVESAAMAGIPFVAPGSNHVRGAAAVVRLSLKTNGTEVNFGELKPETLRFYLKGQTQHVYPLYQLLQKDCLDVVIARAEDDTQPIFLGKQAIQPVGFKEDEGLLPYPAASFSGYQLLTEYFAFPEKFLFLDIAGIGDKLPEDFGTELHIFIFLANSDVELEHNINEDTFALGCTPVVNLFRQKAEPIRLDHTSEEYLIIPDSRYADSLEVYSIDQVKTTSAEGEEKVYQPFYGIRHELMGDDTGAFWHASRRSSAYGGNHRDSGTDVFIHLVDLHFNPDLADNRTLEMELTCNNRDLPAQLPFGKDQPAMHFIDAGPPIEKVRCLTQPSATIRPPLRNHARWRLISHLNLNHLSITGGEDATNALKEILRLYDFKDSATTRAITQSISKIDAIAVNAPVTVGGRASIARGLEIHVELDETLLAGSSPYLFAGVLERFFALYCSVNSFTRVVATLKGKEGILKKCPPQTGEKVLL